MTLDIASKVAVSRSRYVAGFQGLVTEPILAELRRIETACTKNFMEESKVQSDSASVEKFVRDLKTIVYVEDIVKRWIEHAKQVSFDSP